MAGDRSAAPGIVDVGVIHGRFQILHNDHLKYLLAGKALCRTLVVGVTNPDPMLTRSEDADPIRSCPEANPLTYYERMLMVRAALTEAGLGLEEFLVTPFPINIPESYRFYAPMDATFFLTIYDDWGRNKLKRFMDLGLKTRVLWEREQKDKGISGKDVRALIRTGGAWRELVPASVAELVDKWNLRARLARQAP